MMKEEAMLKLALEEARKGVSSGGLPFGAVLLQGEKVISSGYNRQIQDGNFMAHAEMVCLEKVMKEQTQPLQDAVLVATEAPCPMCAGAAVVMGIRKIIVGENVHYSGALDWLAREGVEVQVLNNQECIDFVSHFKQERPACWSRFSAG